jgi:diaminopimelate decarboxylase
MDHFSFNNGHLAAEDIPIHRIAAAVGTPLYVYSTATIERHYRVFANAFSASDCLVCYAVKANGSLAVVRTLARMGCGADVVSGGELRTALAAGINPAAIVYSGVGKTEAELVLALRVGVLQINVESVPELELIDRVARTIGCRARIALRVNPDVDALTHDKISTGRGEDKFGIEWTAAHEIYGRAARLARVQPVGIAVHIGSQLTSLTPFREAFHRVRDLVTMLRADGLPPTTLDLGGGLGVPYGNEPVPPPAPGAYAKVVSETVGDLGCRLILEPGRLLVANAGVLVTRVLYVKRGTTRTFIIVDAGMNDLLRPALYCAHHTVVPEREPPPDVEWNEVDVVGPVCETSDRFASGIRLPPIEQGDLLALRTAGAYGAAMASTYNVRPLVPEVLVRGDAYALIRPRIDVDILLAQQQLPPWLEPEATGEVAAQHP